jgi:hypothetical protein
VLNFYANANSISVLVMKKLVGEKKIPDDSSVSTDRRDVRRNIDELRIEQYARIIEELMATRQGRMTLRLISRLLVEDSQRELRDEKKWCISRAVSTLESPALWVANRAVLPRILPKIIGKYLYSLRYHNSEEQSTASDLKLEVASLKRKLNRSRIGSLVLVMVFAVGSGMVVSLMGVSRGSTQSITPSSLVISGPEARP